tara:strand:+ start:1215 stop:2105 length:891 start_codon:yes stop_codon:yes gene_type:complete
MKTEPEIRTWGQALDYDLKRNKSHGRDKSSYKNILSHCNYFTSLYGRSYPCKRITQDVMDDFIEELQQERSVSDATANRYMATIKAVLNYAHSKKKLPHPYKFSKLTEKPGRPEWYDKKTIDEYERVARSNLFYRNDLADITVFGAYVGARQGEILNIKACDIDLDSYEGRGSIYIGGRPGFSTKNGDWREVPMHPRVRPIIEKRLENAKQHTRIFGDEWSNKDILLRNFKKVLSFMEQPPQMNFHHLRHSFGVWHAEAGTPIRTLMELMGHKTIDTTIMYAKVSNRARAAAMANI